MIYNVKLMEVIYHKGDESIAKVYVAILRNNPEYMVEFVDSVSGSMCRDKKWVVIVSSQFGCPVGCKFCDAHIRFKGNLMASEMVAQVDYLIGKWYPDGIIKSEKFKVQFARMGEPALNSEVIDAIYNIREKYHAKGYMPCVSTVAPIGHEDWFNELVEMNHCVFKGQFQLQFSVHSTDEAIRDRLVPIKKWTLEEIASYGSEFYYDGGRKVTLNFALTKGFSISIDKIVSVFNPRYFVIKLTPTNPTENARKHGLVNVFDSVDERTKRLIFGLEKAGFKVILSIGDLRENQIGSNCGQIIGLMGANSGHNLESISKAL